VAASVIVVQHAEKERLPGDPGLTALGHRQAGATAGWLAAHEAPVALWSSPFRRARETAAPIAGRLGLDVRVDARLRERMNWDDPGLQSFEAFLDDWRRASADRAHVPSSGDSSEEAGHRFLEALTDLAAAHDGGAVVVVAHGGVTVDLLRTLVGDDRLRELDPTLIDEGVPACGLTRLRSGSGGWTVEAVGWTGHLTG
jgi:broad specificity phosphatase PhoE